MKQLYTLEEIHRYTEDIHRTRQQFFEATRMGELQSMEQLKDQIHTMQEVLQRMHESLERHGPLRPSFLQRWAASRETRKLHQDYPLRYGQALADKIIPMIPTGPVRSKPEQPRQPHK